MLSLRILIFFLFMSAAAYSDSSPFADYQWKHRLIIIFAEPASVEGLSDKLKLTQTGIEDRDIVWYILSGDQLLTNQASGWAAPSRDSIWTHYFDSNLSKPQVLLIGKDGGIKSRQSALNLDALFTLIDSMPMRQAEMRSR